MGENKMENKDKYKALKKYKNLIASSVIIVAIAILVIPIIPIQYSVTKTTTRNLKYSSKLVVGVWLVSPYVELTNVDYVGGTFIITIQGTFAGSGQAKLQTKSESVFVDKGEKIIFSSGWTYGSGYDFTYTVSAPSVQESHYENQTEYKSILNLIGEKW